MDVKTEFKVFIKELILKDELQFFCENCLSKMGQPKPKLMYEDTGVCDMCNTTNEVSNPHINLWLIKRELSLDTSDKNSGYELRDIIPFDFFKNFKV